ncbi:MAG: hypothetical protein KC431_16820, partial [Myxococcales bacterium]|nr:hypothetical protein [Myxococcales bacterium]
MKKGRVHLPILNRSEEEEPEDDPLVLLRGGRFARVFALMLGVIGLVWIVGHQVRAASPGGEVEIVEKVHSSLRAAPPKPQVENITPDRGDEGGGAPPMPPIEDITPPMPPVEDITPERGEEGGDGVTVDRFGQKRTASGALILEGEDGGGGDEDLGLSQATRDELAQGGFFDPGAFDDAKTVKTKAYVHLMPGLPNEVLYVGIGLILL